MTDPLGIDALVEKQEKEKADLLTRDWPSEATVGRFDWSQLQQHHPVRQICEQTTWTVDCKDLVGAGIDGRVCRACRQRSNDCNSHVVKVWSCTAQQQQRDKGWTLSDDCYQTLIHASLAGQWGIGPTVVDAWFCPRNEKTEGSVPLDLVDVYMAMDRLSGQTLDKWLTTHRSLDEDTQRAIDSTIRRMHDHGMIHNDLTLSNIVITDDGKARIIDFHTATRIRPDQRIARGRELAFVHDEIAKITGNKLRTKTDTSTRIGERGDPSDPHRGDPSDPHHRPLCTWIVMADSSILIHIHSEHESANRLRRLLESLDAVSTIKLVLV